MVSSPSRVSPSDENAINSRKIKMQKRQIEKYMHLSQKDAAMALGVSCSTLRRRILEYKIRWPRSKQEKQEQKETMENGGTSTVTTFSSHTTTTTQIGQIAASSGHTTHTVSSSSAATPLISPHNVLPLPGDSPFSPDKYQLISKDVYNQLIEENKMLKTCLSRMQTMFVLSQQHNNYDMQAFPSLLPSPNGMLSNKNGSASSNSTTSSDCNSTVMTSHHISSPVSAVPPPQLSSLPSMQHHQFSPTATGHIMMQTTQGGVSSAQLLGAHPHSYLIPQHVSQQVHSGSENTPSFSDQFSEPVKDFLTGADLE